MNKQKDGGETRCDEKGHVTKSYEMQRKGILTRPLNERKARDRRREIGR